MKKKILMVCESFGGGVFSYVSQLCNDMVEEFDIYLAYAIRPQTPDNYKEFLSLQCDSALRNIVRIYPYDIAPNVDTTGDGVADEGSLRGSSEIVASRIRDEIQLRVEEAGIEIVEARITYLAYATEIAAIMLQRQQASAIIDARKMIVDGAVGMVEMALDRLSKNNTVALDDERKAAMVSNLLVVLCGNHDAQPVVNSGSLY